MQGSNYVNEQGKELGEAVRGMKELLGHIRAQVANVPVTKE